MQKQTFPHESCGKSTLQLKIQRQNFLLSVKKGQCFSHIDCLFELNIGTMNLNQPNGKTRTYGEIRHGNGGHVALT